MKPSRHLQGGWVKAKTLPRGPNGRAQCRQCSVEVPVGRLTFCSNACVEVWKVRTGSGAAKFLKRRDKGVCAICRLDCEKLRKELRMMPSERRDLELQRLGIPLRRLYGRRLWDIDHIVPVVEGGGSCGPENLRTLCIPCHLQVTRELAAKRAVERRAAGVEAPHGS